MANRRSVLGDAVNHDAYDVDSGTTAAASADAPSSPTANSTVADEPTTGSSALAACVADVSGPWPPIAAATATMIDIEITLQKIDPTIASARAARWSDGWVPRSATTAAAWSAGCTA